MDRNQYAGFELDNDTIETWIREARDGSSFALGRLIDACRSYLLAIAQRTLPKTLRAKIGPSDLVQETSFEAHRDFASFGGERSEELLGWLRRILLNNAANIIRQYEKAEKRQVCREHSLEVDGMTIGQVQSSSPSPSSLAASIEETQTLDRYLARLPADMRTAIILRNREYLPFEEIGLQLHRSAAAARKLWARAIERLQATLANKDDGI